MIKTVSGVRYKNPHCAACNGHNETECNVQPFITPVTPGERFAVSAAVLFDFYGESVGLQRTCSVGEVWDGLFERCFPLHCGANFVLSGDECVPSPDAANASDTLLSACAKIRLQPAQFARRANGSVFVLVYDRLLAPGQYEEADGGGLLVCAADPAGDISFKYNRVQEHISFVCFTLSIVCLAAHILVHTFFSKLRNLPAKNLLSLSCALLMAQLLYLTGIVQNSIFSLCFLFGISIHYFFLAAFFWMSVMSVDVCRAFTSDTYRPDARRKSFRLYSLYAWGLPALIVGIAIFIDQSGVLAFYRPRYATHLCWFNNPSALGLFFALPVGAVILENAVLFAITVHGIYVQTRASRYAMTRSESVVRSKAGKQREAPPSAGAQQAAKSTPALSNRQARTEKIRFALYLKLALLMGLGWIFGFVARFGGPDWLWYPFLIFNGLQGTFIFAAFDLKRKVLAAVVERVTGRRPGWAAVSKDSGPSSGSSGRTAVSKLSQSSQDGARDSRLRRLPAALRDKLSAGSGRSRRAAPQQDSPNKKRSGEQSSPNKRRSGEQDSPTKRRSGEQSSPTKRRSGEQPSPQKSQDPSPTRRRPQESPLKPKRTTKPDSPHQRRGQLVRAPSELSEPLLLQLPPSERRSSRRRTRDDSQLAEPRAAPEPGRRAGSFESLPSSERLEHKIAEAKRLLRELAEEEPAGKRGLHWTASAAVIPRLNKSATGVYDSDRPHLSGSPAEATVKLRLTGHSRTGIPMALMGALAAR
ncbi:cadherin EGF LAG seven-pass G-type receptor 3-like [Amphibalanus amphitrite]|uniref:cadherin EGF LAG seven-pass G-type receptor 3-like n=1 Tax=Amphibalanus amphitrite TaxID=1232801 RepID=UPI001C9073CE|nr:cadherin EGF LAG seven-pass G-type receptor 3-like [Amphibalanus amphitrite]